MKFQIYLNSCFGTRKTTNAPRQDASDLIKAESFA